MQTGRRKRRGRPDRSGLGPIPQPCGTPHIRFSAGLALLNSTAPSAACVSAGEDGNSEGKDTGEQLLLQQPIITATKIERRTERE